MNKASSRPEKRHLPNTPTLKRAITTIDATHHGSGRNQAPANTTVTVPKVKHGKARRILLPEASQQSAVTVSMRGDLQFIHLGSKPCRLPHFSMPAKDGEQRKVEDAASLGDTIVMVFKNVGHEVSLVTLGEKAKMTDLRSRGHGNGIRTVAPMHSNGSIRFLTGGYDHAVKLWDIVENNGFYDSTIKLVMQNNAPVNSLAWRATAQEIVAAAGAKVYQKDINRRPDVTPVTMSNNVFQIHVHPQNANVVCLEVDHLDKQIQLYDVRVGGFNRRPASEFGYRDQSVSLARRSHYRRGATRHSYFSRGYHDGCTALWDFRRPNSIVVKFMAKREQAVWHTAFANFQTTKLLSFGENHVSIYDLSRCND
ncbi:hypothetical protein BD410DRAFT_14729 [Rickenella mellea]|uniref:Uncharacterized protein n=1 Tax=Rickenella mellea TaxID=50990 RepID=A0A4R5XEX1_9AGAM|nr:hypothetical protein BD410DRAFT_14729 [Rickenella mellea]